MTVVSVYAPTTDHSEDETEEFCEGLQIVKQHTESKVIVKVMGDLNAKVSFRWFRHAVGLFGLGARNDEIEQVVCNTWFRHHPRYL